MAVKRPGAIVADDKKITILAELPMFGGVFESRPVLDKNYCAAETSKLGRGSLEVRLPHSGLVWV
ncbi:MAG: hypothetical protein KBT88_13965 [Gammaproteobacteria bacterium]|nr:hypothetical protein [Gammaproteobacteria bacterium]MBQ0840887.1 hypothetical protein [Gammaproteobacteria bacterium]